MSTFNVRRFAHPDGLKAITPEHLLALLKPYESYFNSRGIELTSSSTTAVLVNYNQLVEVLMTPDSDTPADLIDALFYIHEMATPEGMEALLQEVEKHGIILDNNNHPTAADVAAQVYILSKNIIERVHAEQHLEKPRSFEYFQSLERPMSAFKLPSLEVLTELENNLDEWFEKNNHGKGSRVFVYPKFDSIWFLVRHGNPYKREGSLEGDQSSSVFYRPEKFDVLVYETSIGEIRMNACGKREKDTFRKQFGLHLFNNEDYFPRTAKYTLKPLQTQGELSIVCTDIEGMEWVRLREIHFFRGGAEKEIEIRKANDVFAAYEGRDRSISKNARIIRASFLIKFTDSKSPRTVIIRPSNIAQYTRDSDAIVIENWLFYRGFIISNLTEDE